MPLTKDVLALPRWALSWSNEQILETLRSESRTDDSALFKKFIDVGWRGLAGGNVFFTDGSKESQQRNAKNETCMCHRLCLEFGLLAVDIYYLPRDLMGPAVATVES